MQTHAVDPDGELPLEEIIEAFKNHTQEHPLLYMINPVFEAPSSFYGLLGKSSIEKITTPKMKVFPGGQINKGDFSQGILSNCYLISTLDAILSHEYGSKVIANFIKDLSSQTQLLGKEFENKVMVRVFYPYLDNDITSPTYMEELLSIGYLIFDKSIFVTNKRAIGFPIAQLMEQAFTFLFNNNIAEEEFGEHPYIIYQILFGELHSTYDKWRLNREAFFGLGEKSKKELEQHLLLELSRFHPSNPVQGERNYALYAELLDKKNQDLHDLIKRYWPKIQDRPYDQEADFINFISEARKLNIYTNNSNTKYYIDIIIDYGRGILDPNYNLKYNPLICSIDKAFSDKKIVNITTIENLGNSYAETKEPISKGMVGRHAYAVTGVSQKKEFEGLHADFLPIRNPWGSQGNYGVEYYIYQDSFAPAESHQSEFMIEAKHLEKIISSVSFSETTITDSTANLLSQRALQAIKNKNVKPLHKKVKMTFELPLSKTNNFIINHPLRSPPSRRSLKDILDVFSEIKRDNQSPRISNKKK